MFPLSLRSLLLPPPPPHHLSPSPASLTTGPTIDAATGTLLIIGQQQHNPRHRILCRGNGSNVAFVVGIATAATPGALRLAVGDGVGAAWRDTHCIWRPRVRRWEHAVSASTGLVSSVDGPAGPRLGPCCIRSPENVLGTALDDGVLGAHMSPLTLLLLPLLSLSSS